MVSVELGKGWQVVLDLESAILVSSLSVTKLHDSRKPSPLDLL